MTHRTLAIALLVPLTGSLACKSEPAAKGPATATPADPGTTTATEPGAPNIPWAQKDRKQRTEYMGLYVFPEMKKLFQGHDAQGFAEFKCQTCHGDDMESAEVDFKMPNDLYTLPADDPMGAAAEYDAEVTKFMAEQVVPKMAELLGKEPGTEFGCLNCHPTE